MALTFDPNNPDSAELRGLERQRAMANALTQSGLQPVSGGQMVSGRYVPTSGLQNLASLANIAAGQYLGGKAEAKEMELAKGLRDRKAAEIDKFTQEYVPGQEAQQGPTMGGGNLDQTPEGMAKAQQGLTQQERMAFALKAENPLLQQAGAKMLEQTYTPKTPKWEKTEIVDPRTGNTTLGYVDVNAKNPSATFTPLGIGKEGISRADRARFADEGIGIPGGGGAGGGFSSAPTFGGGGNQTMATAGNTPVVQGANAQQANSPQAVQANTGGIKAGSPAAPSGNIAAQSDRPQYVYDPSLSPKDNRTARAEMMKSWNTENAKNVKNANDSFGTIKAANEILAAGNASSGRGSNFLTGVGEFFGNSSNASKDDAQLKILGGKLTMAVPRFEGPQSDKDTALYQSLAGDIGNANVPIDTRRAALQQLVQLHQKYAPDKRWGEIFPETAVDNQNPLLSGKVSLGPARR
jgi:hypothetical protein